MSQEQLKRYTVIEKTLEGIMTIREAAEVLDLSDRQGYTPEKRSERKPPTDKISFINRWYLIWCGERDLNPHGHPIRPSNVRVCQFRHPRIFLPCNFRLYYVYKFQSIIIFLSVSDFCKLVHHGLLVMYAACFGIYDSPPLLCKKSIKYVAIVHDKC